MNMDARRQYFKVLQERYFMTKSRKDKSSILDEYSRNTRQNREYAIRRIHSFSKGSLTGRGMTFSFTERVT